MRLLHRLPICSWQNKDREEIMERTISYVCDLLEARMTWFSDFLKTIQARTYWQNPCQIKLNICNGAADWYIIITDRTKLNLSVGLSSKKENYRRKKKSEAISGGIREKKYVRGVGESLREEKKWGHLEGQNNLEPINQSIQWDPSTLPHSSTYSSHDVIRQRAATLCIKAHRLGDKR